MKRLVVAVAVSSLLVVACACKSRGAGGTGAGTGTDSGTGTGTGSVADCEAVRGHVEALYRALATSAAAEGAEAGATAPSVDEAVADNVTMVMTDCAADPGRVAACAGQARDVAQLESTCLIPLDDSGSEGDRFKGQ